MTQTTDRLYISGNGAVKFFSSRQNSILCRQHIRPNWFEIVQAYKISKAAAILLAKADELVEWPFEESDMHDIHHAHFRPSQSETAYPHTQSRNYVVPTRVYTSDIR